MRVSEAQRRVLSALNDGWCIMITGGITNSAFWHDKQKPNNGGQPANINTVFACRRRGWVEERPECPGATFWITEAGRLALEEAEHASK